MLSTGTRCHTRAQDGGRYKWVQCVYANDEDDAWVFSTTINEQPREEEEMEKNTRGKNRKEAFAITRGELAGVGLDSKGCRPLVSL